MIIEDKEITRGLIIDEPWIGKILSGEKTWEMRSNETKIRGTIALIKKGSGQIVGIANLVDCGASDPNDECYLGGENLLNSFKHKHCIDYLKNPELIKWNVPWFLREVKSIIPIPYKHKRGAVIWVKL